MSQQPKTLTATTQQTQTQAPSPIAEDYWKDLLQKTETAFNRTNTNPFQGDFIAQPTQYATQGVDYLRSILPSLGQGAQDVIDLGQKTAQGYFLSPDSNPFIKAAADAAVGRVNEGLMQTALPAITDQAIAQGAYGGARQDLSQERAVRDFSRSALDATTGMYAQNYAMERGYQQQAPQMLGAGYELLATPGNAMLSLDEIQRGQQQLALDNALAQFREQQGSYWSGIPEQANILSMLNNFGTSSTSGTTTQPNPNYESPFMSAMKMALGGAGAIGTLGGSTGFGLWGKAPVVRPY